MAIENSVTAEVWRDPTARPSDRVSDLISRMTIREKVAQLYGIWVGIDTEQGTVAPHQHEFADDPVDWESIVRHGVGQLTRAFGTAPVDPVVGARAVAESQRQIMASSRFGIPAMVHEECLTGLAAWQATIYPSPLCWAASFDPDLVRQMGARIGRTMRRLGVHQGLAPVVDVVRDLRWGRVEETMGEDPYLVGLIGSAYVGGLESSGIVSTLKHFVGYSASRAGRNLAPVSIGRREIADVLLPPFEAALLAGARSVMNAYVDIDGVPAAADPALLTDLLRGTYGFTGTVVADYFSVAFLQALHGVAGTRGEAAELALRAGIDVELPTVNCYGEPLAAAVESGLVDPGLVDRALERVLRQKFELGLLDPDWEPEAPILSESDPEPLDDPASRELAGRIARRSVVLLGNDGTLPLPPRTRVAVVGPRANDPGSMFGCYSFPLHVGVHHPGVPVGVESSTLLDALRADASGYEVTYSQGCPVVGGDPADIATAAEVARGADVCVAVLGDQAGLFGNGTSGEGCDAADLRLPGRQEELLEAVLATGTPVVLVLLVGRPYDITRQIDRLAAAVCAFFPGEEGAAALADVLSGRVNPSGRLPVSFPGSSSNQPSTYLAPALGEKNDGSVVDPTPLFPFGHGLAYHAATWVGVERREAAGEPWATDGTLGLEVLLRNDTAVPVSEVVQVYLHDPVAEVARPRRLLIAAPRVDLPPGETRRVLIDVPADLTSYTGAAGRRQVDPGAVELLVGASSSDIRGTIPATLAGPRREVGFDRDRHATVTVLLPAS